MSDETKLNILSSINKYLVQKRNNPDYVDFYELYGIDPNIKYSELKSDLRRVRKMFHIDQMVYLPAIYHNI